MVKKIENKVRSKWMEYKTLFITNFNTVIYGSFVLFAALYFLEWEGKFVKKYGVLLMESFLK